MRSTLENLTAEERRIYSRISRRGFMGATAAGTLAALVGREPTLVQGAQPGQAHATADAMIVLWMAGGMAQTETFDPKRYTPFEKGVRIEQRAQHVSRDRHRGRRHQVHQRARAGRQRDGSRRRDSIVHGGRPRVHPALPPSVSLAYRLHSAAADGDAAHRVGHLANARAEEPRHAGVRRHRPDGRRGRRDRHAEGVSHGGLPRLRAWPVPDRRSAGWRLLLCGPPKELGESRFRSRRQLFEKLLAQEPVYQHASDFQRESLVRSLDSADRLLNSPSAKAFDLSLEPRQARSTPTAPRASARAVCSPAAWSRAARATSRSRRSTFRSSTGTRTNTVTSAPRR